MIGPPKGLYVLDQLNHSSQYHLAFHVSYPNASDRARAKQAGCNPGGDIMIHALRNGMGWLGRLQRAVDWTHGCIAVTNDEIEEIGSRVQVGTKVRIDP